MYKAVSKGASIKTKTDLEEPATEVQDDDSDDNWEDTSKRRGIFD